MRIEDMGYISNIQVFEFSPSSESLFESIQSVKVVILSV